jgi:hypothetical protein
MAEIRHYDHEREDISRSGWRHISWGSVFAGTIVAISLQFLLALLGLAIGLSVIDPAAEANPMAGLGVGSMIWWLISGLISLFVGAWAAAHLAGEREKTDGALHGVLTWGVTLVLSLLLITNAVGAVIGGAFNALSAGLSATAQAAQTTTSQMTDDMNIQAIASSVRNQIRQMTQGQQQGEATLEQAQANGQAQGGQQGMEVQQAWREMNQLIDELFTSRGQVDQERLAQLLAQNTGMSEQQAQQRVQNWVNQAEQLQQQTVQAVDTAVDTTATAAWWTFVMLLLGVGAAFGGGLLGSTTHSRTHTVINRERHVEHDRDHPGPVA